MILLLMRHGVAEDGPEAEDAARALTNKGRRNARAVAIQLARLEMTPTLYLSSPRIRAVQTAEEVCATHGSKNNQVECITELDFGAAWPGLHGEILRRVPLRKREEAIILAASHEPICGEFLGEALGLPHPAMPFKKGALAAIKWKNAEAEGPGELLLYLTPAMARRG